MAFSLNHYMTTIELYYSEANGFDMILFFGVGEKRYDICPDKSAIERPSAYLTKKLSPYTRDFFFFLPS